MVDLNPTDLAYALSMGLAQAAQNLGAMLPNLILSILLAIIVLLVGFFVSGLLGRLASDLMDYFKVESVFKKYKVEDALGGTQVTSILAAFVRWYTMLLFLQQAILILDLGVLTSFITSVLLYVPSIIGAALLVIAAAVVGEWVRETLMALHKFYMQQTLARAVKWAIILTAILVGLDTMGYHLAFVYTLVNTVLTGIVYGVALAFGLAFGLGGQKDAQQLIGKARRKFDV